MLEITIKGNVKEIAALILTVQERQEIKDRLDVDLRGLSFEAFEQVLNLVKELKQNPATNLSK